MERILVNLLINAVRVSGPEQGGGGKVGLELEALDGEAVLRVTDSGPGVDPELGQDIFERFTQGKRSKGSSGIGLYFCRRAARLMGGEVDYHNLESNGAVFELRLPLAESQPG